jgi:hypothetical protein
MLRERCRASGECRAIRQDECRYCVRFCDMHSFMVTINLPFASNTFVPSRVLAVVLICINCTFRERI